MVHFSLSGSELYLSKHKNTLCVCLCLCVSERGGGGRGRGRETRHVRRKLYYCEMKDLKGEVTEKDMVNMDKIFLNEIYHFINIVYGAFFR